MLARWVKEHQRLSDGQAFCGNGKLTPEQVGICQLKEENIDYYRQELLEAVQDIAKVGDDSAFGSRLSICQQGLPATVESLRSCRQHGSQRRLLGETATRGALGTMPLQKVSLEG